MLQDPRAAAKARSIGAGAQDRHLQESRSQRFAADPGHRWGLALCCSACVGARPVNAGQHRARGSCTRSSCRHRARAMCARASRPCAGETASTAQDAPVLRLRWVSRRGRPIHKGGQGTVLAPSSVRVIHRCYNRCAGAPYVRATSILCVRATACVCARALLSAFDGGPRAPMCAC